MIGPMRPRLHPIIYLSITPLIGVVGRGLLGGNFVLRGERELGIVRMIVQPSVEAVIVCAVCVPAGPWIPLGDCNLRATYFASEL